MDSHASDDWRITAEAADWLVELNAAGTSCHAEFFEWVRRSPEHVREFLAVTALAGKLKGADPQRRIDVNELLRDDRAGVVQLPAMKSRASSTPHPQPAGKRWTWRLAAGVAAIALAAGLWTVSRPEIYLTQIGEQRTFVLSDGSLIYLNTSSKAQVRFSERMREVELLAGEALFTVERDPTRPFRVKAGSVAVQAVGTQFNVYRRSDVETTVSVIEGAVLAGSTRLNAGEQVNIRKGGEGAKQTVPDIDNVVAWRQRQLVFRKTPLTRVAAEFNRYNRRQIHVDGQAALERQITGVFAADRPESFVLFMKKDEEIRVRDDAAGWMIEGLQGKRPAAHIPPDSLALPASACRQESNECAATMPFQSSASP